MLHSEQLVLSILEILGNVENVHWMFFNCTGGKTLWLRLNSITVVEFLRRYGAACVVTTGGTGTRECHIVMDNNDGIIVHTCK